MWPINLPVRRLLRLPEPAWLTWATFDADWYRRSYPEETAHLADAPAAAILAHYFDHGQSLGHSPNRYFDEAWHRRAYPWTADLVAQGRFESAFDSYCQGGCLERSPHWLFDERAYRQRHADLTDDALRERGLANGYDHYLWRGASEGRVGHPFLDPAMVTPAEDGEPTNPFLRVLARMEAGAPESAVSAHLDPTWYRERYPELAIEAEGWRWALRHYLCNDTPTAFDPNPGFSEAYYLAHHEDARAAVERRAERNGYSHFLRHGMAGNRSPRGGFDLGWYARQDPVRREVEQGLAPNAFVHWLLLGRAGGLATAAPIDVQITEAQAKALFRAGAAMLAALYGRDPLNFEVTGRPALSVLMILHDQFELTMRALGSLRATYPGAIELILIDSGSTDATRGIERYVRGATVVRFETNIGYLKGCNAALQFATADAILYLNNDVELAPGAVTAALRRLNGDSRVGLVGGMVVRTHGRLQEAGCIIYNDGSTQGYMRDASPLAPEANFVRDVEYCSGVFLLGRRALLSDLGGYDDAFAPAYYEDVDLCLRVTQARYRVVYDPAVMLVHLEFGSATREGEAREAMNHARALFQRKHAAYLATRPGRDPDGLVAARSPLPARRRVLFIEDTVPLRTIGSGFVRSNDLVRTMAALDWDVTVFPNLHRRLDPIAIRADLPDTAEVMHEHEFSRLSDFLASRRDHYDAIWIARTHNLDAVRPVLDQYLDACTRRPRIILDTEAVAATREAQLARLRGEDFDLDAAIAVELRHAGWCDRIIAVTESEAALLREHGYDAVSVIGHQQTIRPTPRAFARRSGMLFVGAIHRMDSPNYDSLCWFVDHVLPLIDAELKWQTRLTVAGYTTQEVDLRRFADHPRITLRGVVTDLDHLYDTHHVFVAPTRFAAGIPYKVHEAAAHGLPVVATTLLGEQLDWRSGTDLLTAPADDPEAFARALITLQRDESLWTSVRNAALERLRAENDPELYARQVTAILEGPKDDQR